MATSEEKRKFSYAIDSYAANNNLSYIDAIIAYCDSVNLELESAALLINKTLKEKIELEASEAKLLKYKIPRLTL